MTSNLERTFQTLWKQLGGCDLKAEYKFHPKRQWRFDFAIPERKIGIEVEGGLWKSGRHNRAQGYTNDCEKYNEAQLLGWYVFRFTSLMFDDPIKYILPIINHKIKQLPSLCPQCQKSIPVNDDICDECVPF